MCLVMFLVIGAITCFISSSSLKRILLVHFHQSDMIMTRCDDSLLSRKFFFLSESQNYTG